LLHNNYLKTEKKFHNDNIFTKELKTLRFAAKPSKNLPAVLCIPSFAMVSTAHIDISATNLYKGNAANSAFFSKLGKRTQDILTIPSTASVTSRNWTFGVTLTQQHDVAHVCGF